MNTLDEVDSAEPVVVPKVSSGGSDRLVRAAPHLLVWTLLLIPTLRSMAQGWRPLSDDATIAIGAWNSLSLHPPLLGQLTNATSTPGVSDPGPLEYWLLSPFAHLDPGQGVLLGSAILCAVILSVTLEILWRRAGVWAAVIFSLVIADLAITSPTPYVDPVWNSSFGFFWFAAFLGVAFVVGLGNLRYFPLLLFIGSVTVDSHLQYLPTVGLLLVGTGVCGWFTKKPSDYRWLWWSGGVAVLCWAAPVYQQLFEAKGNISLLLHTSGILSSGPGPKSEGLVFGLRALSRAASPFNPIWASPRSIFPLAAATDIGHRNLFPSFVLPVLVGVAIVAWKKKKPFVVSMCVVSIGGALGTVFVLAHTPVSFLLAFSWVNLLVWQVGICIWLTLGLSVVTAIRSWYPRKESTRVSAKTKQAAMLAGLGAACIAGTVVALFPYDSQFVQSRSGVARVERMTADIEHHVHRGRVSIGVLSSPQNLTTIFQRISDEDGTAYLLLTAGWHMAADPPLSVLPEVRIHPQDPFVVFRERGATLASAHFYSHYKEFWWVKKN